jgi:rRNA maturation RNase YbeY
LRRSDFTVCFVDDREIQRLNTTYRHKSQPTDVLSFPWQGSKQDSGPVEAEFRKYLGDVVISAETARRHAREDGQVTQNEIRRLILHGLLHLLGYDHEADHGEMNSLESLMRAQLGV